MEHTPAPYGPRAVYGYAMYIGSNMLFLLYVIWAIIPDEVLHDYLGLTYWPSKYWAVAIPIWALTALATFAFLIYPAINMLITPDIDVSTTVHLILISGLPFVKIRVMFQNGTCVMGPFSK
ncbi:PREDICTED: phosphatidylinositol N-acetylglucosaminyltransferase subunit P isoform X2 [Wasmannia auropunctata]|uniref:phosphatidylinositol N-acetylglucosaminyltransferase subunit P isoform X2 n=1 Tax=Wasmannia auropunctata TaxID=64793 RepID=UPI0005F06AE9|nr:PREDICTED: phosphatidylinositol N-acetylglucosaminyltransferase subunit P isoform X2 [Wasmannia auropunctata]